MLLFYLELGLVCTKVYRFLEYTPVKGFNNFLQPAVNARRQGGENPNACVVASVMKLLANSFYGYQVLDDSRHSVTRYNIYGKTHAAMNNEVFKRLGHINDHLYKVELAKSETEHEEPIIVGFSTLQYAKLENVGALLTCLQRFTMLASMRWNWLPIHSI